MIQYNNISVIITSTPGYDNIVAEAETDNVLLFRLTTEPNNDDKAVIEFVDQTSEGIVYRMLLDDFYRVLNDAKLKYGLK